MSSNPEWIQFAQFTARERAAVDAIVARALPLFLALGVERTPLDVLMDLSAVHARCPLRLEEFATADDGNFGHDITGIYRHLNRETGHLENFFVPRFAC